MISRRLLAASVSREVLHCTRTVAAHMGSFAKVEVKQGTVVGCEGTLPNGSSYSYFRGIPYAAPPMGDLRFQAPVPLERFAAKEIDCTKEGDVCFHKDAFSSSLLGSENCLFLNVYAPRKRTDVPLPVMLFIHGGGYMFGSGNSALYEPLYLIQEDVIVVTLNYRLGALGFLSLPEGNIPGNAGLKDQRLALEWVKENISQFNGDPNNVTLFGESAGASCVHLHLLSDNSRKLFHKVIMQSGTANMSWAMQEKRYYKATTLARLMGCTSEDPLVIAKFLEAHPNLMNFVKHAQTVLDPDEIRRALPLPFKPVVEKESAEAVVTEEPLQAMNKTNTIDIPVMMGYNSAEGIAMLVNAIKKIELFDKDLGRLIPRNINLDPKDPECLYLAKNIRNFYFKGTKLEKKTLNQFVDLLSDFHFVIDKQVAAEIHSRKQHNSPLFFYRFDYIGALNMFKQIFQLNYIKGTCHADELFYLFQTAITKEPWEDRDKRMVQMVCKLWTNFAKYGNPTPEQGEQFIDCLWEPVRKVNNEEKFTLNALIIDEKPKMLDNPDAERMDFWRNVYRTYNGSLTSKL